jgi:hypothetical protein
MAGYAIYLCPWPCTVTQQTKIYENQIWPAMQIYLCPWPCTITQKTKIYENQIWPAMQIYLCPWPCTVTQKTKIYENQIWPAMQIYLCPWPCTQNSNYFTLLSLFTLQLYFLITWDSEYLIPINSLTLLK